MSDTEGWIRIEREFDGPIDLIWAMWTEPERFKSWYGPRGMDVPLAEMDLAIGGTRKVAMQMTTPERTMTMWFTGVYKEISPPHRLVYTEAMCDEDGTLIPPQAMGMPEGTPQITEVIVELTDLGDRTNMVMVHRGVPAGSAGEGGWNQAFDKLEDMFIPEG